jgi:hypothetical protein
MKKDVELNFESRLAESKRLLDLKQREIDQIS